MVLWPVLGRNKAGDPTSMAKQTEEVREKKYANESEKRLRGSNASHELLCAKVLAGLLTGLDTVK